MSLAEQVFMAVIADIVEVVGFEPSDKLVFEFADIVYVNGICEIDGIIDDTASGCI